MNSENPPISLAEVRNKLDLIAGTDSSATSNQELANAVFACQQANAILRNAIAWQCRRRKMEFLPDDVMPVIYEIWSSSKWKWAPYHHIDDHHLKGYLFRVAQKTTGRWLRSEQPLGSSFEGFENACAIVDLLDDEDDLKQDFRIHIQESHLESRVRLAVLMLIEVNDLKKTADLLNISEGTLRRYLRMAMQTINQWLED